MSTIEVKVPDIGDFKDVPVIEVFVKPGDTVKTEDSLVTLESDKATMDVPSPATGTVRELKVKVGDRVSEGTVVVTLEAAEAEGPRVASAEPTDHLGREIVSATASAREPSPIPGLPAAGVRS